jgi:hypothetical protein
VSVKGVLGCAGDFEKMLYDNAQLARVYLHAIVVWFRDGHCVDCFLRFPILDHLAGQPVQCMDVLPHQRQALCRPDRPVTWHKQPGSEVRDCLQNMEQSFWIAAAQIEMVPDKEQVAHQVRLGIRHERVVGAVPSCGDEQAAGFPGGDDLGVCAENLVAPDVVVVPVAIDGSVDGAAG